MPVPGFVGAIGGCACVTTPLAIVTGAVKLRTFGAVPVVTSTVAGGETEATLAAPLVRAP